MADSAGIRIGWRDLPQHVRDAVESILGDTVLHASGQSGGFSPGTADRVITAGGRRAFVKAVGVSLNPDSPGIHRAEARIAGMLPRELPVAHLIGTHDDGDWVALVLDDIEGRQPAVPWSASDLAIVLDALRMIAMVDAPELFAELPRAEAELEGLFGGWRRLIDNRPSTFGLPGHLEEWVAPRLEVLDALAQEGLADLAGESLVHHDIRADNVLITADGTAMIVDWPWACRGAGWIDALTVLLNVRVYDRASDVEAVLCEHPVFEHASADAVTRVLAGFASYFVDVARTPAPPGLPTLRDFQRVQGEACVAWLRERLGA